MNAHPRDAKGRFVRRTTPWIARDRAALDHPHNRLALHIIELRGLTWRFAVKQAGSTPRIEPHHPVPDDLKSDTTDLRRFGARRTVIDRCNSKSRRACGPSFVFLARPRRCEALKSPRNATGIAMTSLHRSPPLNQSETELGIVNESQLLRFGIS